MHMKNVTPKSVRFSKIELEHLWKSWVAVSLAFAVAMSMPNFLSVGLVMNFIIAALTVGLGFILHELAHKIVAIRYRCFAEYRANFQMLFMAVALSFLGVVFAAPGAVVIDGHVSRKQIGHISVAGPLTNIALAVVFLIASFVLPTGGFLSMIFIYGFNINAWIALFNLLPFGNFDGRKILAWNKGVYFALITGFILLRVVGEAIFSL
jgi:Zn-dependent protease